MLFTSGKQAARIAILGFLLERDGLQAGGRLMQHGRSVASAHGYVLSSRSAQNVLGNLVREGLVRGPVKATREVGYGRLDWEINPERHDEAKEEYDTAMVPVSNWILYELRDGKPISLETPLSVADYAAIRYALQRKGKLTFTATDPKEF